MPQAERVLLLLPGERGWQAGLDRARSLSVTPNRLVRLRAWVSF